MRNCGYPFINLLVIQKYVYNFLNFPKNGINRLTKPIGLVRCDKATRLIVCTWALVAQPGRLAKLIHRFGRATCSVDAP